MKTKFFLVSLLAIVVLYSCNSEKSKIDTETYHNYLKKGDDITNLTQATLLGNVSKAMQAGGPEYAVAFCNLKAFSLVDSLSNLNDCRISRVTVKNRNPDNNLKTEQEKVIWEKMQLKTSIDTLVQSGQALVYYKSIKIALPACLKCHGTPDSEISPGTMEKISRLYPNDLATGYGLGDFRGMWKVEFKKN